MDKLERQGELYIKQHAYAYRVHNGKKIDGFFRLTDERVRTLALPDFGKTMADEDISSNLRKYIEDAATLDLNIFDHEINETIFVPEMRPIFLSSKARYYVAADLKFVLPKNMDLFTLTFREFNQFAEVYENKYRAIIANKALGDFANQSFQTSSGQTYTVEERPTYLPELHTVSFAHYDKDERIF